MFRALVALDERVEIRDRPAKRFVVRPIAAVVFRLIMKHELLGLVPLSLVLSLGLSACGGDDGVKDRRRRPAKPARSVLEAGSVDAPHSVKQGR